MIYAMRTWLRLQNILADSAAKLSSYQVVHFFCQASSVIVSFVVWLKFFHFGGV